MERCARVRNRAGAPDRAPLRAATSRSPRPPYFNDKNAITADPVDPRFAYAVWDRLNQYRIELGRSFESADPQRALGFYAAVPEDSPQFADARTAIHRVWQNVQRRSFQQQTVAQLLRDAEAHFAAGRLLTPVHRNAYSAYQAVLAIEPQNDTALRRIDQIRQHCRSEGEAQFRAGNWDRALPYLEAFILLEPGALDVRAKTARCQSLRRLIKRIVRNGTCVD